MNTAAQPALSAIGLRDLIDHLGWPQPIREDLDKAAEALRELLALRREVWVVAECIFRNISADEAKHWARGIRVSLSGASPVPSLSVPPAEQEPYRSVMERIQQLMPMDPLVGTPEGTELDLLAALAEFYEKRDMPEFDAGVQKLKREITPFGVRLAHTSRGAEVAPSFQGRVAEWMA